MVSRAGTHWQAQANSNIVEMKTGWCVKLPEHQVRLVVPFKKYSNEYAHRVAVRCEGLLQRAEQEMKKLTREELKSKCRDKDLKCPIGKKWYLSALIVDFARELELKVKDGEPLEAFETLELQNVTVDTPSIPGTARDNRVVTDATRQLVPFEVESIVQAKSNPTIDFDQINLTVPFQAVNKTDHFAQTEDVFTVCLGSTVEISKKRTIRSVLRALVFLNSQTPEDVQGIVNNVCLNSQLTPLGIIVPNVQPSNTAETVCASLPKGWFKCLRADSIQLEEKSIAAFTYPLVWHYDPKEPSCVAICRTGKYKEIKVMDCTSGEAKTFEEMADIKTQEVVQGVLKSHLGRVGVDVLDIGPAGVAKALAMVERELHLACQSASSSSVGPDSLKLGLCQAAVLRKLCSLNLHVQVSVRLGGFHRYAGDAIKKPQLVVESLRDFMDEALISSAANFQL